MGLPGIGLSRREIGTRQLLRLCACIEAEPERLAEIGAVAAAVRDWADVASQAEEHGLTPLAWRHLRLTRTPIPRDAGRAFVALAARHRTATQVQLQALGEILDALETAGIECLVLKGAALTHTLYPEPGLRPMRDLDLLVPSAAAWRAQATIARLGFQPISVSSRQVWWPHHHLPPAARSQEGFRVWVEIHTDAFSRDRGERLRLDSLSTAPREIRTRDRCLRMLGHVDMLRHLAGHALEPASDIRLIAVADVIGYAARFHTEIDWELLTERYPTVVNLLTLLDYVSPLPSVLQRFRPTDAVRAPRGIGEGFTPLSTLIRRQPRPDRLIVEILYPPEWWMHAYYGVRPGASLGRVRWGRHLRRLGWWGIRRAAASLRRSADPL